MENVKKKFMDALRDGDTDSIGKLAGQMPDEVLEELQRQIWDGESSSMPAEEIEAAYRCFARRTGEVRHHNAVRNFVFSAAGIAAALVAGIFIGGRTSDNGNAVQEAVCWIECCTPYGDTDEVLLPDGSRVHVNSGSVLLYPDRMDGATREIHLVGEAFIEVAKDTLHPFIVHAGGTQIKVTGTKFNVKAYAGDSKVTTTLVEGGVDVTLPSGTQAYHLTPGCAIAYERKTGCAEVYSISQDMYPSWYRGEFNAYHLTLAEIAMDLERRFGIRIIISDSRVADMMFYASFINGESAEEIIDALNVDSSFRTVKENSVIHIMSID